MGFGNPYGDPYNEDIVMEWVDKLVRLDIATISVADTVGLARAEQVSSILGSLIPRYPETVIGVHLHSTPGTWLAKTEAAFLAGCTRFEGTLKGIGGCPMAHDDLVGNIDTELMISYFDELNLLEHFDRSALSECSRMAGELFANGPFNTPGIGI
jgi:hydroxymethylglutaryl-CoA lyase